MPNPHGTPESLEKAARASRFHFAKQRVEKIINGLPELTEDQRRELAEMLHPFVPGSKADAS